MCSCRLAYVAFLIFFAPQILLCDSCDSGYHTACLRPPLMIIPDGEWFCPPCQHVSGKICASSFFFFLNYIEFHFLGTDSTQPLMCIKYAVSYIEHVNIVFVSSRNSCVRSWKNSCWTWMSIWKRGNVRREGRNVTDWLQCLNCNSIVCAHIS